MNPSLSDRLSEAHWIDRFANRLGQLCPALPAIEATGHAKQIYADAADLEPEEAAEIYALDLPPGDTGEAGAP